VAFARLPTGRGASSSEGYTVRRLGSPITQFYIEYSEGAKTLRYYLENLMPGAIDKLVPSEIGPWLPPHAGEKLSSADKLQIANRISDAMQFLGDRVAIESGGAS